MPAEPVKILPQQFSGKDVKTKLEELRKELEKKKSSGFIVSLLDEIAWLFNLRGNDIPYNPVFFSYATITPTAATLYVSSSKLSSECTSYLAENGVDIRPYESIFGDAEALGQALGVVNGESQPETKVRKFLVSNKTSWALKRALGGEEKVEETRSPIGDAKAVKNETELEGMRQCHIRDGAALTEYFAWLENQLIAEKAEIDEVAAADKLEEIRTRQKNYAGLSFDTISSTGANAAVIHYKPEPGNCSVIDPKAIYLCDSGAQYFDGTTDTTRTLHFGEPTEIEKKAYTLVLKGHVALDVSVFPKGTSGLHWILWQDNSYGYEKLLPQLCFASTNIPTGVWPGLQTRHRSWRRLVPQCTRGPDRHWHQNPVLGSPSRTGECDIERAWVLRRRILRNPH